MPQVFRVGAYLVHFLSDEGRPLEPIHVHVAQGAPRENAKKIWITSKGHCLLSNNRSEVPDRQLRIIMRTIEAQYREIEEQWVQYFGKIRYHC